jgi:hypothetical protein
VLPNPSDWLSAIELTGSAPEDLDAFISSGIDRWSRRSRKLGLKAD